MRYRMSLAATAAALAIPIIAGAQTMTAAAPVLNGAAPVLAIGREVIKPGKGPAHTRLETAWSRSLEAAKYAQGFVALTSMSGPNEVWFVSPYASLDAMQKANEAYDANPAMMAISEKYVPAEVEFLADGGRSMILTLRPELSYSNGRALSDMRFLTVQRIQVRAGHAAEFTESRTAIKAAHEKAKLSDGFAVYQATSGMPGGTFYVLATRKSLAELDDNTKTHADPAYQAALGVDWLKKNALLVQAYEASSDNNVFAVNPAMSVVSKEWKDADAFWRPKLVAKKTP